MISWLKGRVIQKWHLQSKEGVVIDVRGIGYELQLLSKHVNIINNSELQEFWVHQINRDDNTNLYGFEQISQRDLFRQVISVTGIGPQIGMKLLDDFEANELAEAIELNNYNLLTKSQGIGKRTAQRLVVELKNKLSRFKDTKILNSNQKEVITMDNFSSYFEEIKSTLITLGYQDYEIQDSLELLKANQENNISTINSLSQDSKNELLDKHLKEILIKLSQKST
tara:strand:- start:2268 stop:2942 length:675 start_codon:yes stop_codon:yes gene_type:complete